MRRGLGIAAALAACSFEGLSLWAAFSLPAGIVIALILHVVAAFCSLAAARRVGTPLDREADAVLMLALLVPLFGPAIAWMMPVADEAEAEAAQEMLEQVDARLEHEGEYSRPFYLGDFEADLARQVNSISYYEVLERGDLEQKRDALRKLARLGEPRHMALVARALEDSEPELRLCAYLELDRVRQRHERKIARLQEAAYKLPEHARGAFVDKLRSDLAAAHLDYAVSGALDDTMREFRLDRCLEECHRALLFHRDNVRALVIQARALCERGCLDDAESSLDLLPVDLLGHRTLLALRARICFERRDFEQAKAVGFAMLQSRVEPPKWLHALCGEHDLEWEHRARLPHEVDTGATEAGEPALDPEAEEDHALAS